MWQGCYNIVVSSPWEVEMSKLERASSSFRLYPVEDLFLFQPKQPAPAERKRRLFPWSLRSLLLLALILPPILASAINSRQSSKPFKPRAASSALTPRAPVFVRLPTRRANLPPGSGIKDGIPLDPDIRFDRFDRGGS